MEDVRDIRAINDINAFRNLLAFVPEKVGSPLSVNSLVHDVGKAYATVRDWASLLDILYFTFSIKPYSKRIQRSLKAEPKTYLYDILRLKDSDIGLRRENLAAIHLLKAVQFWNDTAAGEFELCYLRDKEKREVDFLVTWDKKPWVMVECKSSEKSISKNLLYFSELLKPTHCFQLCDSPGYDRFHAEPKVRVMSYQKFFSMWV